MSAVIEEIVQLYWQSEMSNMYIAIPCKITNIPKGLEDLRVDVQPIVNVKYMDETSEEHTQILGVPVMFPAGRASMVSFPLFVGDTVLCVFAHASLDNFKSGSGQFQDPSDFRRLDSRDAIAIPGLVPFSKSLNNPDVRGWTHNTQDLVVAHNIGLASEVEIRMQPNGNLIINTNQDVIVNAENATVNASATLTIDSPSTTWTGDVTHTGSFTSNGVELHTHTHGGVQSGANNTGVPN